MGGKAIGIDKLPKPDREKTLPDGSVSRFWTSGRRTARVRTKDGRSQLDVFSGKELVMGHWGSNSYAFGFIQGFTSAPQPK